MSLRLILARVLLALPLLAGGCRLVDQRTFQRAPAAPAASELQRQALLVLPLVTIRFDQRDIDWQGPLQEAVLNAQARKPDVAFDVIVPIPLGESREAQDRAQTQGQQDAILVANALLRNGVSADRVRLGFRGDPGRPPREVLVYAH